MTRWICAVALVTGLGACGVTYTSPTVQAQAGSDKVRVLALTGETVLLANRSAYTPRRLPAVFSATAGSGRPRAAGGMPPAPDLGGSPPTAVQLRLPPPTTAQPYRIGVGDEVSLAMKAALPGDPVAPPVHTVRDDGAITLPEIGTVQVAGLTLAEAEAEVFRALVAKQIDPAFSLEVTGFHARRIAVGGAVGAPTLVPVTLTPPSLDEAITLSGGLAVADRDYGVIRLYRDGQLYQIPFSDYFGQADLRKLPLQPDDSIYVDQTYDLDRAAAFYRQRIEGLAASTAARAHALAELQTEVGLRRAALDEARRNFDARAAHDAEARDYVYLAGEVAQQGRFTLPYGRQATLADVLYDGGGFATETGDPAHIYVLRAATDPGAFGAVTAWHLNASNAAMIPLATRMEMRPNDVVFIQEQPITRWNRALKQVFPPLLSAAAN